MSSTKLSQLAAYSACDIADALLKLEVPGAGFLPDILPIPTPGQPAQASVKRTIGPASTILFTPHSTPSFPSRSSSAGSILASTFSLPSPNVPKGTHWVDNTLPGSIAVLSQPEGQACAVVGGIIASRMREKGLKGVVVHGRVRDLGTLGEIARGDTNGTLPGQQQELDQATIEWQQDQNIVDSLHEAPPPALPPRPAAQGARREWGPMPIWSKGTSIVGAGAETKPWAINVPVMVGAVEVNPGDYILLDPAERGAVCIPAKLVEKVLLLLPKLVEADEQVLKFVEQGGLVSEAFRLYRG